MALKLASVKVVGLDSVAALAVVAVELLLVAAGGVGCGGAGLKGSNGANSGVSCFSGAGAFCATGGAGFFTTGLGLMTLGGGGGAGFGGAAAALGAGIVTIETSIGNGLASVMFSSGFFNSINSQICNSNTSIANNHNIRAGRSSPCKAAQNRRANGAELIVDSTYNAVLLFRKAPSLLFNKNIKQLIKLVKNLSYYIKKHHNTSNLNLT